MNYACNFRDQLLMLITISKFGITFDKFNKGHPLLKHTQGHTVKCFRIVRENEILVVTQKQIF